MGEYKIFWQFLVSWFFGFWFFEALQKVKMKNDVGYLNLHQKVPIWTLFEPYFTISLKIEFTPSWVFKCPFKVYVSIYILHSYISGCYVGIDSHFIFSILPFVWVNNTLTSCQTFCWLGNITGWCCGGRMWLNFVGTANIPSWFPDLIIVITVQC